MKSTFEKVSVAINEAWKGESATEIDDTSVRRREGVDLGIATYGYDSFAARRQRFSPWLGFVAGPESTTAQNQTGFRRLVCERVCKHTGSLGDNIRLLAVVNREDYRDVFGAVGQANESGIMTN